MAATELFDLKRNGASRPVSARNLNSITGQLALFRYKSGPLRFKGRTYSRNSCLGTHDEDC